MENIGVIAVVSQLATFTQDMKKVDSAITSVIPGASWVSNAFKGLGSVVEWLTGSVLNVLEYTLGNLLSSAIQAVVSNIKDLIAGVFDSADAMSKLEIRLGRLNFNALIDSGVEYQEALKKSIEMTKEQLDWSIRLGGQTSFSSQDIADVFTLAQGYGFSADEAKGLTESIIDFTAGMGLSGEEMERIIVNFGQMRQQGKLTGTDLRDLARGSFVPINKVLELTAQKLGMSVEEFNTLKKSGKLTAESVDVFRQSFQELVGVNFEGAANALGNVFSVAQENVKSLTRELLATYVASPVLLSIGTRIQEITNALTENDGAWAKLTDSLKRIGTSLTNIVERIFGLGDSSEEMVDNLITSVDEVANWFEAHEDTIVKWVEDAVAWVRNELIPAIKDVKDWLFGTDTSTGFIGKVADLINDVLIPAFERVAKWLDDNSQKIDDFFNALGDIGGDVFSNLFGGLEGAGGETDFLGGLLDGISAFMDYVIENKDTISSLIALFIEAAFVIGVVGYVMSNIITTIAGFISFLGKLAMAWMMVSGFMGMLVETGILATIAGLFQGLIDVGAFLIAMLGAITLPIWALIAAVAVLAILWIKYSDEIKTAFSQLVVIIAFYLDQWWNNVKTAWNQMWAIIGYYIQEIVNTVTTAFSQLVVIIGFYVTQWWNNVKTAWNQMWFIVKYYAGKLWNEIVNLWNRAVSKTGDFVINLINSITSGFTNIYNTIREKLKQIYDGIKNKFSEVLNSITNLNWYQTGVSMMQGLISGITNMASSLVDAATSAVTNAINSARSVLGIHSPSKVFFGIGENVVEGMNEGIKSTEGVLKDTMKNMSLDVAGIGANSSVAMASRMAPAMSSMVTNTNTKNYNLNINSSAATEPIIADFYMLESLG